MHRPQEHNSQQRSVAHFKPIMNFGQKRLETGGGSERNVDKKGYRSRIDKIFKIFIDKNNRLCGHQNSCKL